MTVAFKPRRSNKRVKANPFVQVRQPNNVISLDRIRQNRGVQPSSYGLKIPPVDTVEVRPRVVEVLPTSQDRPLWLKSLITIKHLSSVAACLLMGTTLAFYGLKVYGESRWVQQYPRLESLRHQEQQLRMAKEVLKHTIVESAQDPKAGLAVATPDDIIYVQPAPPRQVTVNMSKIVNPHRFSDGETNRPLAY